jgi:hypothetical protein
MALNIKPTLENLEARCVPSATAIAAQSPLMGPAYRVAVRAFNNYEVALDIYEHQYSNQAAAVQSLTNSENSLRNAMHLYETYETYFQEMGYSGTYFHVYDTYFREIDASVVGLINCINGNCGPM